LQWKHEIPARSLHKIILSVKNNKHKAFENNTMYTNAIETTLETVKQGVTAKPNLYTGHFSRILKQSMQPETVDCTEAAFKKRSHGSGGNGVVDRVQIGTLSEQNPSVSNLLIKHPVYGRDCWKIIHSSVNQNKPFENIRKGISVYVDPKNLEITWGNQSQTMNGEPKAISNAPPTSEKVSEAKRDHQICLGTLSKGTPTVSHLLIRNTAYGKNCWNILSHDLNRSKNFNTIPKDTPIYLNVATREISWDSQITPNVTKPLETPPTHLIQKTPIAKSDPFSQRLATAVKPYIGTSYNKINCFELIVHGLEEIGIQYRGPGGLGNRLIKSAMAKGLPENHYLSGEGLIETSGSLVYTKSIPRIKRSGKEALALYKEIEPLLRKGQILSFSTPNRGHTGIVSKRGRHWTYINSGNMDHLISGRSKKGVGEESLGPEIRNWFRLAANSGETLSVTIGRLNEGKLKRNTGPQTVSKDQAI
jgi:hypothetical protein